MRRITLPLLLSLSLGSSLEAQQAKQAFVTGLVGTVLPVAGGIALMVAGHGDFERDETSVGFLLASGGLLLGPSLGDWVGGSTGRGLAGLGLRTAALIGGAAAAYGICGWNCGPGDSDATIAQVVAVGALGLTVGLAVWDLTTLRHRMRTPRAGGATLAPLFVPSTRAAGIAVHLRF